MLVRIRYKSSRCENSLIILYIGHGAANVTLGIPRLREIVMTASQKPKTPSMSLPLLDNVQEDVVQAFCKHANRLTLSQITDNVQVNELLASTRRRQFKVSISFYPKEEYREEYDVEGSEILSAFSIKFPQILRREIQMELKKLQADIKALSDVGVATGREENPTSAEDGDEDAVADPVPADDVSEVGDGDADDEKRARQSKQQATYESDDDDDSMGGEFDKAAIEAEFASDNGDSDSEDVIMEDQSEDLEAQIVEVRKNFIANMRVATNFSFSESGVTFELEVRQITTYGEK